MSELLEKILDNRNMNEAYRKVCANKGAGGVDGMGLEELDGYIRENWDGIRERTTSLFSGSASFDAILVK